MINVLKERFFTEPQINKILHSLKGKIEDPRHVAETIDTWNRVMGSQSYSFYSNHNNNANVESIPPTAAPPRNSPLNHKNININTILADIEPRLIQMHPDMVWNRKTRIDKLAFANNSNDFWQILFNAPTGFFLQEWQELAKKVFYVDRKVIPYLFDKKQRKEMITHPIVKAAAISETNFDHIRTRYLFAQRSGYKTISGLIKVKSHEEMPSIKDMILSDNMTYLRIFAPYCSFEEYSAFSNLMKNHDLDEDDAEIFEELAKVSDLDCKSFVKNK